MSLDFEFETDEERDYHLANIETVLSTGEKSTLGEYLARSESLFGKNSKACIFLRDKIEENPFGKYGEVIQEETQLVQLLIGIHLGKTPYTQKYDHGIYNG